MSGAVTADPLTLATGTIGSNCFATVNAAISAAEAVAAADGIPPEVVVNGRPTRAITASSATKLCSTTRSRFWYNMAL